MKTKRLCARTRPRRPCRSGSADGRVRELRDSRQLRDRHRRMRRLSPCTHVGQHDHVDGHAGHGARTRRCSSPRRPRCGSSATRVTTPRARVLTPTSSRASTRAPCTAPRAPSSTVAVSTRSTRRPRPRPTCTRVRRGAPTVVATSAPATTFAADGSNAGQGPNAFMTGTGNAIKMDCATCHDPHGSANYRILKAVGQRQHRRWLHRRRPTPHGPRPQRLRLLGRDGLAGQRLPSAHAVPGLRAQLHHADVRQGLRHARRDAGNGPPAWTSTRA